MEIMEGVERHVGRIWPVIRPMALHVKDFQRREGIGLEITLWNWYTLIRSSRSALGLEDFIREFLELSLKEGGDKYVLLYVSKSTNSDLSFRRDCIGHVDWAENIYPRKKS